MTGMPETGQRERLTVSISENICSCLNLNQNKNEIVQSNIFLVITLIFQSLGYCSILPNYFHYPVVISVLLSVCLCHGSVLLVVRPPPSLSPKAPLWPGVSCDLWPSNLCSVARWPRWRGAAGWEAGVSSQ